MELRKSVLVLEEIFVDLIAECAQFCQQVLDRLRKCLYALTDCIKRVIRHSNVASMRFDLWLLLLHVDHEELIVLVRPVNVVFLLPDDSCA